MQEIHSMGGGRFFGGGGGDRRLRPHHNHNNHQALKCPRCDSLNTKFCYYNNYNLSQPRHFCKNCRRYWTKGGVLRNVPVGGGCRKSKRSNKPPKNSSSETTPAPPEPTEHNTHSHSSSESSSLTAANTATAATTEAVSEPTLNSDSNNNNSNNHNLLENMQESKLLVHQNLSSNPVLETCALEHQGAGDSGIFSEIGSFTSLITSTNDALAFGFNNSIPDASSFQWQHQKVMTMGISGDHHRHHEEELKLPDNLSGGGSLLDHGTVPVDLSALQNKTGHGGFGSLDWQGDADQGLFDLSNGVDQPYWTQAHWSDHDNSTLFHLP